MKRFHKKQAVILFRIAELLLVLVLLIHWGTIRPNRHLVPGRYCKGVDISHYQGRVDMDMLSLQGIDFIYVKATEGSKTVDEYYARNAQNAMDAGLLSGAYHFFSFDSAGRTQAQHFIQTIGSQDGNLIPAVDIEYYGNKRKNPPKIDDVTSSLQECLDLLEEEYHQKPVIYTTLSFYHKYIRGRFQEYPLWIRNVYFPAVISVGKNWTFWQYDDKTALVGYEGDEKYIDKNVFHGDWNKLEKLKVHN